ncbi:MAG: hypothetical protein PHQ28_02990 [Mycobacterium sp.]|nr:hypothetical protein [Mycobacterium sp.]
MGDVPIYYSVVAFGDLTSEQTATAQRTIADAALESAQLLAAEYLLAGPLSGVVNDAEQVANVLRHRLTSDPRFELLHAFEKPWALLVVRLLASVVSDPATAVRDARDRGAGVPEIAETLGITEAAVYRRYPDEVVRRVRKK